MNNYAIKRLFYRRLPFSVRWPRLTCSVRTVPYCWHFLTIFWYKATSSLPPRMLPQKYMCIFRLRAGWELKGWKEDSTNYKLNCCKTVKFKIKTAQTRQNFTAVLLSWTPPSSTSHLKFKQLAPPCGCQELLTLSLWIKKGVTELPTKLMSCQWIQYIAMKAFVRNLKTFGN